MSTDNEPLGAAEEQSPKQKKQKQVPEQRFRLNIYRNGMLRADISKAVFRDMSAKYGDVMRAISPNMWQTLDELTESYWNMDRRLNFGANRTRKNIESALAELVEHDFISIR